MTDRLNSSEHQENLFPANSERWPILIKRDEIITLKEAVFQTGKSDKTIRLWCKKYQIARQVSPGAPLEISAPALNMVLHADIRALELLREERRDHPRVKRHFLHVGLPG